MSAISITVTPEGVVLRAPYNGALRQRARAAGGRWTGEAWLFAPSVEDAVLAMATEIFGDDGRPETRRGTIRIRSLRQVVSRGCDSVYWRGRPIARATGRDSGALPCEGVRVISGSLRSGGSRANWLSIVVKDAILEIDDVPLDGLRSDGDFEVVEISAHAQLAIARAAMITERARLAARIAEIDAAIGSQPAEHS